MKIIIHRGSHEIGGTCIQLSTGNTTILLDLGLPLSAQSKELNVGTLKPDAVIISHSHQDHYGLIDQLHTDVPVYIGELAKGLIDATRIFLGKTLHTNSFRHFTSWQPFDVGDFTITPYLMDHSAVDAYGFLIEAEGKKIYYSGDFRATGRKHKLFDNMVKKPPKNIDLLFLEGTMLHRNSDAFPKEESVEEKILEILRRQKNISFIISSSQNIDRIVSAHRACKQAGKRLVIDIYTAWILEQVRRVSTSVPSMEWDEVRVYADFGFDKRLKEQPEYFGDFRRRLYKHRVRWKELISSPADYLYFGRMSSFRKIKSFRGQEPVNVIYSQWEGYLKGSNKDYFGAEQMAAMRHDPQVNFVYAHTSGHATVEDLQRFVQALQAKQLVPVHTEYGNEYRNFFGESVVDIKGWGDGGVMIDCGENMTRQAKVGMFWCIGETVVGEAVTLSEAEPYGDALQYGGHYDFWCHLKPQIDAERKLKSHAYDYYPRGRVVFFQSRQQVRLYVDGCLSTGDREAIAKFFGLAGIQLEIERDTHYQCAGCNLGYLE